MKTASPRVVGTSISVSACKTKDVVKVEGHERDTLVYLALEVKNH